MQRARQSEWRCGAIVSDTVEIDEKRMTGNTWIAGLTIDWCNNSVEEVLVVERTKRRVTLIASHLLSTVSSVYVRVCMCTGTVCVYNTYSTEAATPPTVLHQHSLQHPRVASLIAT